MRFVPWASLALLGALFGGGYGCIAGARPDILLAFFCAFSAERAPLGAGAAIAAAFAAARFIASPPDGRGEALAFSGLCLAILAGIAIVPNRFGVLRLLATVAASFLGLVALTLLWQKGTGAPSGLPPTGRLALSLLLTALVALGFHTIMADRKEAP